MNLSEPDSISQINNRARKKALTQFNAAPVTPTDMIKYHSRGRVAVIGGEDAVEFAPRLRDKLQPQVVLMDGAEEPGVPLVAAAGRTVTIQGHLGAFRITLGEKGKANAETVEVDLVLDLNDPPLLSRQMTPPGYYTASTDEASLSRVAAEILDMTGTFTKPRYFAYDPSICAHSRAGKTACTRCIDSCPAEAIHSSGEQIEVDPYLCQGGGVCATVCPAGAVRYNYPSAEDLLKNIRMLLQTYAEAGGKQPVLAFISQSEDYPVELYEQSNILSVPVEEIGSVGMEVWLTALAYGAQSVLLVNSGSITVKVSQALDLQLQITADILAAMHYPRDSVRRVKPIDFEHTQAARMPTVSAATFSISDGKRQAAFFALDHLYKQADKTRPMIPLSSGAMFGTVNVEEHCTLCLSCVSACPGKALHSGNETPQLQFVEANCLQCGMCTRICPENAISISPRLLFDREQRNRLRIVHEEPAFNCISCGKPFATASVIESMLVKLHHHPMFQQQRARNRLKMCEDCRVLDVVQDEDAMAGFDDNSVH